MRKNNFYISFGVWLVIIPLLGVPIAWRDALVFISGIFFILVSIGPIVLEKLQVKSKKKQDNHNPLNPPYLKGEKEEALNTFSKEDNSETPS